MTRTDRSKPRQCRRQSRLIGDEDELAVRLLAKIEALQCHRQREETVFVVERRQDFEAVSFPELETVGVHLAADDPANPVSWNCNSSPALNPTASSTAVSQ